MSELISSPQSESGHEAARAGSDPGRDRLQQPTIVVRYDAAFDPSDRAGEVDGDDPGAVPGPGGVGTRIRAFLDALARGLLATTWALMRAAYRYPRWAVVIVFSILILGAIALTRPGKPMPKAVISPPNATASSSGSDGKENTKKDGKGPESDRTKLVKADPTPPARPKGNETGDRSPESPAAAPPLDPAPAPSTPIAVAGPTNSTVAEGTLPPLDSTTTNKESVPAPPPLAAQTGASLLDGATAGPTPAPAPPTPSPTESRATPTVPAASSPHPNPGPPPLPGPEADSPLTPAPSGLAPRANATPVQPAESAPPAIVGEVRLTGGADVGNAPVGTTGSGQQPAAPPNAGTPTQPSQPKPDPTTPGSSPAPDPASPQPSGPPSPTTLPPITKPADTAALKESTAKVEPTKPEPPKIEPTTKPEPPKIEPTTKPEPPKIEPNASAPPPSQPGPGTTPGTEPQRIEDRVAKPETVHGEQGPPEPPHPTTEAGPGPGPPGSGPAAQAVNTKPEPEVSRPEAAKAEKPTGAETPGPNLLEGNPEPKRAGAPAGVQGSVDQPGTMEQPGTLGPKAVSPPQSREVVPSASMSEEPLSSKPTSEPAAPGTPEKPARDEATGPKPGTSAAEPAGSSTQTVPEPSETGWVRIPNKGRIPSHLAASSDAAGEAGRPAMEPSLDRPAGFESGSPAPRPPGRPGSTDARDIVGSAVLATGLGQPVADPRMPAGSRAGAGSSRVEPSLHTVARGENFWIISRLYYGDGRYYRALWKANAQKYPDIKQLHINDVILIPAPEDLEPALVGLPRTRQVSGRDEGSTRDEAPGQDGPAPARMTRADSSAMTRTARTSEQPGNIAGRGRPGRADAELALPIGDADGGPAPGGRVPTSARVDDDEDAGTATRLTARPRNAAPADRPRNAAPVDRPVYKVRRYDTLRSIARDALGDTRRADEIYEMNREVIADPTRLTPGQLLELPEDADTRRVTSRDRSRGS
jgi:nucleoid-associated protein YgaU